MGGGLSPDPSFEDRFSPPINPKSGGDTPPGHPPFLKIPRGVIGAAKIMTARDVKGFYAFLPPGILYCSPILGGISFLSSPENHVEQRKNNYEKKLTRAVTTADVMPLFDSGALPDHFQRKSMLWQPRYCINDLPERLDLSNVGDFKRPPKSLLIGGKKFHTNM